MTRFEFRLERGESMQTATRPALVSNKMLWAGRIISALVVLFLLFDSSIKLIQLAPVIEGTIRLGYPVSLVRAIGLILLVCTVLYTIPRTSMVGAIMLTGYLGGAVASQLRLGEPLLSHVLFPVYFGVLLWVGLFFRDGRLRELVPLRRPKAAL
jgi:hypothetical protein